MIHCETQQIRAVQRSQEVTVAKVADAISEPATKIILASSRRIHKHADRSTDYGDGITINSEVARQLEVEAGSSCVILSLSPRQLTCFAWLSLHRRSESIAYFTRVDSCVGQVTTPRKVETIGLRR